MNSINKTSNRLVHGHLTIVMQFRTDGNVSNPYVYGEYGIQLNVTNGISY